MEYFAPLLSGNEKPDFDKSPTASISSFHWEKEGYSRPESFAKLLAVEGRGIYAKLWSFEENLRCVYTERDDPVYTDSCLEIFLMPVEGDKRYINFEVNPCGVYLSQIGENRNERSFIREITDAQPVITPVSFAENGRNAWGYEIFLSDEFISSVYGTRYSTSERIIKGNFYKCADSSVSPHYGAFFPVSTAALGFHNPECFGKIIIRKA